jgi:quinol monooxygenase YgiN
MILVAGTVKVRRESRDEAVRLALVMAAATRAEKGCRRYAFHAALDDPDTFFIFEEWESEEALARHFETEHMAAFRRELPRLVAGAPAITRYVVQDASPM